MECKRSESDDVIRFLRELSIFPDVVIKVYRRRSDDPNKWEYLGSYDLGSFDLDSEPEVDLHRLESASVNDLEGFIPSRWIRRRWGGGAYQFRFYWRDELGQEELKRSRNLKIDGPPLPKR